MEPTCWQEEHLSSAEIHLQHCVQWEIWVQAAQCLRRLRQVHLQTPLASSSCESGPAGPQECNARALTCY
jgi:hypothetical protein